MPESYPGPLAGQRITASLLRSMLPQTLRKTSDTSRSATTTVTADPHLQLEVEANAVYIWEGWIKYGGGTTGDLNLDFSAPSGSLGEWAGIGGGSSAVTGASAAPALVTDTVTSRGYMVRLETSDVAQARSFGTLGVSDALHIALHGTLRVGSTPGTWSLDWAQNTSDATATTLYTDSWVRFQRVA